MSEIRKWLEAIGLGQYGDAFEANKIDMDLLRQVDDQILKDIGLSAAGDRLRIRNAIAKLAPAPVAEVSLSATTPTHDTAASAERRQLTVMFCDLVGSTALSADLSRPMLFGKDRFGSETSQTVLAAGRKKYHRAKGQVCARSGPFRFDRERALAS